MIRRRGARRSWLAVVALTALLVTAGSWLPGRATASNSQPTGDLPFSIQLSQTTDLVNGQPVQVEVTMDPGYTVSSGLVYICRPGETYAAISDTASSNGKCPVDRPISPAVSETSSWALFPYSSGTRARGTIVAQVGVAEWTNGLDPPNDRQFTLPCNPESPCQLVVRVAVSTPSGPQQFIDSSTLLTFQAEDPFAGCDGQAAGAPTSGGADRMLWAWREWTATQCQGTGGAAGAASTTAPIPDEGLGVAQFAAGTRDIAYSAAGYGQPGFDPAQAQPATPRRPMVPTPVALNAVVLAAAGGSFTSDDPNWPAGVARPYTDIRLTPDEIAILLGQNQIVLRSNRREEVLARNPELGEIYSLNNYSPPMALSSTSAISLFMTAYLDARAQSEWRAPAGQGDAPRGVDPNLGLANPSYTEGGSLSLVSDQGLIERAAYRRFLNISPNDLGPQWVLTDLATATRLGLTPVSIQNGAGEYVRPTPESLAAALGSMQPQEDDTLAPDIDATAPGAYPLTMVEYALAPAEPLVDEACQPRTASQELLDAWLSYITGDGQAVLPDGFVPLTAALREEAAQAVSRVGASPSTCEGPGEETPGGPTTTTPPPAGGPGAANGPVGYDGLGPSSDGTGSGDGDDTETTGAREPTDEDRRRAREAAEEAEIEMPGLFPIRAVDELLSPLAILLIVTLTSSTAFLTSGRPVPAGVTAVPRRLGRGLAAARQRIRPPSTGGGRRSLRPGFARGVLGFFSRSTS